MTRYRLEIVSKWSDLVFSCILDDRFLLMKKSPKLKMMRLIWFSHYKLVLGRGIVWKRFQNDPIWCFPAFLMIGSSWWKRVGNWNWCDWLDLLIINKFWVEKSVRNGFKIFRLSILLHSWWSVPHDEKESETEIGAIDLIFSL